MNEDDAKKRLPNLTPRADDDLADAYRFNLLNDEVVEKAFLKMAQDHAECTIGRSISIVFFSCDITVRLSHIISS